MVNHVQVFRKQWETYQKIIHQNELNHLDVLNAIEIILKEAPQCSTVCDLGCGDCWLPFRVISQGALPKLTTFVGVDLTQEALDIAATTSSLPPDVTLQLLQGDIKAFLQDTPQRFDLILSSYALHHFLPAEKGDVIKGVARCLNPGGLFIWADVFNSIPGSSRDQVMVRWEKKFLKGLTSVSPSEAETIWEHVSTYDYPETLERMKGLMHEVGLCDVRAVYVEQGDNAMSVVLCGLKPSQ